MSCFNPGSAAGLYGLLPQDLKELTSPSIGEDGKVIHLILLSNVHSDIVRILYSAQLIAHKNGGNRPIAVSLAPD